MSKDGGGQPTGLLVVGYAGNTGSTLLGTLTLLEAGLLDWEAIPSSIPTTVRAPPLRRVCFGGWDVTAAELAEVIRARQLIPRELISHVEPRIAAGFPGITTPLDYYYRGDDSPDVRAGHLICRARADVARFVAATECARPLVVYLGSPARQATPPLAHISTIAELHQRPLGSLPASVIYAAAAIEEGADFIDFTPSEALTCPALWECAEAMGVQLVGRDGSTGQTMLKAAVAEMLSLRGLEPRSWYSSNHLGNADGRVLADPDFNWLKLADKTRGLAELLQTGVDHVVSIDFMESKGDRKESFDSVLARDLFGGEVRLRLNWEAWDSALAVPMLLDLLRLVLLGRTLELRGVQEQLGFFFKSPVRGQCRSPADGHSYMVSFYLDAARKA